MVRALYPGSFDPVTKGHIDIAARAAALFEEVVIAVYATPSKNLLFTTDERVELFRDAVCHLPNVKFDSLKDWSSGSPRKSVPRSSSGDCAAAQTSSTNTKWHS